MAVGLDQDTESLQRGSIPSGGAGTLSDGGFTKCFAGVWLYRPSSGNSYGLTADGAIIHFQAGAREVKLGFDNTFGAGTPSDPLLQVVFNSGGGTGAVQTFSGANFLDEWVYYFIAENPTDGQIAGYIRLSNLSSATTITRTNDNAGSQYVNTLTFGNASGNTTGVLGHYAYARAAYDSTDGFNTTDALAFAASSVPGSGMWGFWPLDTNTDNVDDSGNSRDLTFNGTLTTETSPTFLTITSQPADATVNAGVAPVFSITATGATSYQWQDNSSGSFANVSGGSGATTATYTAPAAAYSHQGRLFRCVLNGTTNSNSATLRVAFNLTGTGPRAYPVLGGVIGAGSVESWLRGADAGGAPSHSTTGAIAAQAATLSGSATHLTLHATTGTLSAQAATISGTAAHQHVATGSLAAQAATLAGTATHLTLHTTTGALGSQAATISGAAQHQHATTGALSAQTATIAGSADHTTAGASHATSGALAAQASTLAGSATHLTLHATSGALAAQSATVAGSAAHQHATTGALSAQDSSLSGSAAHLTLHTTTGALSAQAAAITGAAAHEHATSGALSAQAATVSGAATHAAAGVHIATGALQAGSSSISGAANVDPVTGFAGGWWMPPRRKKKQPEPEVVEQAIEAVEEEPQTALADALRTAAAKAANQAQKGAEDALVQFVKELEARRAADEAQRLANEAWLADLARAEAEMRRRREDEETALLFILTARKRKSRQPA